MSIMRGIDIDTPAKKPPLLIRGTLSWEGYCCRDLSFLLQIRKLPKHADSFQHFPDDDLSMLPFCRACVRGAQTGRGTAAKTCLFVYEVLKLESCTDAKSYQPLLV